MVESNASALSHIHTRNRFWGQKRYCETRRDGQSYREGGEVHQMTAWRPQGRLGMINGVSNSRQAATDLCPSCRQCASNRAALSGSRAGHSCSVLSATTWWALKPEPPWDRLFLAMGSQLVGGVYWYGGMTCRGTLLLL